MRPEPAIDQVVEFRDRVGVFRDRTHAGEVLADMLERFRGSGALVLAIPAGGVPVAQAVAARLGLALDVAVVSKVTLPWNTEAGYGAVAFDGTVRLNEALLLRLGLSAREVEEGVERTRDKVIRRAHAFRAGRPLPQLTDRPVILVDDGLASGFTMQVAVEAVRSEGAREIIVAVPTGHEDTVARLARSVQAVYCANVRGGRSFAVASAYREWHDVTEADAQSILDAHRKDLPR